MKLTLAQRSNFLPVTAWGYVWWRQQSLTLLTGQAFALAREARLFLSLARPRPHEHWLDIGTSSGFYAGVLARAGCQVDALDLSPAFLAEAARREPSDRIRWLSLNGENTGLPDESYDGVTIGATLNETTDPAAMLHEAARLLRPGGRLWLMYVSGTGGTAQLFLARLAGLTFPELGWIERQLPHLQLLHAVRCGPVELALLRKECRAPTQI